VFRTGAEDTPGPGRDSPPPPVVAAATAHLFEGRNVVQIEGLWKQYRGQTEGGHYFKEILVNSDHLVHLFMRSLSDPDISAVGDCADRVAAVAEGAAASRTSPFGVTPGERGALRCGLSVTSGPPRPQRR